MNAVAPSKCLIRRSARAKRLRLLVRPGMIELVIPLAMAETQALAFLSQHREWAERKARELSNRVGRLSPSASLATGTTLPWQGRELPLLITEGVGCQMRVVVDESVHITLPPGLGEMHDVLAWRALYAWVRDWMPARVDVLVMRHAVRYGLRPREIRIKHMKTRWGSCGPKNDMNLNWLLAFTPPTVLEYVVVHELCHIRERNHSPAFWSLVANHLPDYLAERHWLRRHGAALMQRFHLHRHEQN